MKTLNLNHYNNSNQLSLTQAINIKQLSKQLSQLFWQLFQALLQLSSSITTTLSIPLLLLLLSKAKARVRVVIITTILINNLTTSFNLANATAYIKEVDEASETSVNISSKDLNRIKVIGDKIKHIKSSEGEIIISPINELGDVYIKIVDASIQSASVFIITEKGYTYKLLLKPKDMPSNQIILKNSSALSNISDTTKQSTNSENNLSPGSDTTEKQQILELIKSMQNNTLPETTKYETYSESGTYLKTKELEVKKLTLYKGETFTGLILKVKNRSDEKDITLLERTFEREGVRAVLLESNIIPKSETILAYIILQ